MSSCEACFARSPRPQRLADAPCSPLPSVRLAGTIGHVAHGKSTVVKAISGVLTVRFKNELERNITIKLGYANAKVRLRSRWLLPAAPSCFPCSLLPPLPSCQAAQLTLPSPRSPCVPPLPPFRPTSQIYKCREPSCPRPACYKSYPSSKEDDPPCEVPGCKGTMELLRHVSFIGASFFLPRFACGLVMRARWWTVRWGWAG